MIKKAINFVKKHRLLILIIFLGLFLRLYKLDELPGEMWGDVNEHFKFTKRILAGNLSFDFWCGDGPIFSYFVAFISKFFGLSFYTIKLTSVLIGTFLIIVNYFLGKEYFKSKKIGYLMGILTAVSFWTLTFSRQGKPYILTPVFTSLSFLFYLKRRYFLSGLIIGLGMYLQSGFWGMFLFAFLNWRMLLVVFFLSLKLFFDLLQKNILLNPNSYLGEKLVSSFNEGITNFIFGIARNYFLNLKALFCEGDRVFRHNIPFQPHLDIIVGIFFLVSLFFIVSSIIKEKKYRHLILFFLIFLSILPTSLDVINRLNNPAMGRTLDLVVPLFLITAYGIDRVIKNNLILFSILSAIFILNFYRYFFVYPKTLPNRNIPFGKIIAVEIEKSSKELPVFIVGCCWGEWGQPEPDSIRQRLKKEIYFFHADGNPEEFSCLGLKKELVRKGGRRFLLVVDPREKDKVFLETQNCVKKKKVYLIRQSGFDIGWVIEGEIE